MFYPISIEELTDQIAQGEMALQNGYEKSLYEFWKLIKIAPEKWIEGEYGKERGGFWVVGIYGKSVVWYNDIEEGFNISKFDVYGTIKDCGYEQYDLNQIIYQLYNGLLYIKK